MIGEIRACIAQLKILEQKVEHAFYELEQLINENVQLKQQLNECKGNSQEPTSEVSNNES